MNTSLAHTNHPPFSGLLEAFLSFQRCYKPSRGTGKHTHRLKSRVSIPPTMWCPHRAQERSTFILLHQSARIHFIYSQTVGKYAVRCNWQEATVVVCIMSMNMIPIDLGCQTSQTGLILLYQILLKAYNFQWLLTLAAYLHSHWQPSGGTTPENTLCLSSVSLCCQLIYSAQL